MVGQAWKICALNPQLDQGTSAVNFGINWH